ncbi:MAG TPA: hypothetical protein VII38_18435 [Polyangia bacterium]|jgi:hypothetical protein
MAQRTKRRVKQRAKSHQKGVKAKRKRRIRSRRKIGYGTRTRRAKNLGKK